MSAIAQQVAKDFTQSLFSDAIAKRLPVPTHADCYDLQEPVVLSNQSYLGLCEPLSHYNYNKGVAVSDVNDICEAHEVAVEELKTSYDQKFSEQALLLQALQDKVAELEKAPPQKVKKERKKKTQEEKQNSGGANANAQSRLQKDGKLEPFREGGCRCRTWGDRMGTQCSNKNVVGGFCKMHNGKIEKNSGWHLGFYDEERPETWGSAKDCDFVPKWEKRDGKIGWSMGAEEYKVAFLRDIQKEEVVPVPPLEDPPNFSDEEESASTIAFTDDEEEEVVEAPKDAFESSSGEGSEDNSENHY